MFVYLAIGLTPRAWGAFVAVLVLGVLLFTSALPGVSPPWDSLLTATAGLLATGRLGGEGRR